LYAHPAFATRGPSTHARIAAGTQGAAGGPGVYDNYLEERLGPTPVLGNRVSANRVIRRDHDWWDAR